MLLINLLSPCIGQY